MIYWCLAGLMEALTTCRTWAIGEDNRRSRSVANSLRKSEYNFSLDGISINEVVTCLGVFNSVMSSWSSGYSLSEFVCPATALLRLPLRLQACRQFFCTARCLWNSSCANRSIGLVGHCRGDRGEGRIRRVVCAVCTKRRRRRGWRNLATPRSRRNRYRLSSECPAGRGLLSPA